MTAELDALLAEHARREARADSGGGEARQLRQHRLGRLTARERVAALVDPGSFVELGRHVLHRHAHADEALAANVHPGDGLVCGLATVDGRGVAVYAHDPTVLRGALGHAASRKLCRLLDLAGERGLPVVALADSDGVRIAEGTDAIDAYGEVIRRTVRLRGKSFQITLVCGLCVGAAAYCAALTDAVGMVAGQSFLFITGPSVTQVATGEQVTIEALGGPELHARTTGACHAVLPDERAGIAWVRRLLGYLAPAAPVPVDAVPRLEKLVPTSPRRAYDMRKVLAALFDADSPTELAPDFGGSLLTALARLGGRAVAVLASQPQVNAGCLDVDSSRKGAAFVRLANRLRLPVITLVDVPGYRPGQAQEAGGILPHGAELLAAYGEAEVPKLCLVVRKSYGGASVLSFNADVRLALPTAEIAPMGADAAAQLLADEDGRAAFREAWKARYGAAWTAAESGYLDQIVAPADARRALAAALARVCA